MNDNNLDGVLQEWLDAGPNVAPDRLHESVVREARASRQAAPNWWRWTTARFPSMNAFANLAIAAAVGAVVAVVGFNLLMAGRALPGGDPSNGPLGSNAPTERPRPSSTGSPEVNPESHDFTIRRHTWTVDDVRFSFGTDEPGWEPYGAFLISKSEFGPQGAEGIVYWARYKDFNSDETAPVPCGPWSNSPEHSVAYLAEAMSTAPGVELVEPSSEVTIGGRSATHLVVAVRERLGCDPGYFFNWRAKAGGAMWQMASVGDTLQVWIFDLQPEPLFMIAQTNSDATRQFEEQIQRIIGSMRFH